MAILRAMKLRAICMVPVMMLGCSGPKAPPAADCDAFATQFAARLSSPSDGELTKKAIDVERMTYKSQCQADHWSAALTSCMRRTPKDGDIFTSCTSEFGPDQAKHLKDRVQQQADDLRHAIQGSLAAPQ